MSSKEQSVDLFKLRAALKAAQMLSSLSIKALQQPNTTPILFYKMSFTVYSYLDKMPFTRALIPYGFALKTEHEYLLSNSPEKINAYYCGYDKVQAVMHKNFLANKYKDSWIIVDLATGTPIFNYINLAFMVLSTKKAGFNTFIIGIKNPNQIIKHKRLYHLYKIV